MADIVYVDKGEIEAQLDAIASKLGHLAAGGSLAEKASYDLFVGQFEFHLVFHGLSCRASATFEAWGESRRARGGEKDADAPAAGSVFMACAKVKLWLAGQERQDDAAGFGGLAFSDGNQDEASWAAAVEKMLKKAARDACLNLLLGPAFQAALEARGIEEAIGPKKEAPRMGAKRV